jgi:hypothetical protein
MSAASSDGTEADFADLARSLSDAAECGDLERLLRLTRAAVCLRPDSTDSTEQLAKVHLLWRDYFGAAEWLERVMAINPINPSPATSLIYAYAQVAGVEGIRNSMRRLPPLVETAAARGLDVTRIVELQDTVAGFEAWSRALLSPPQLRFFDEVDESTDVRLMRKALLACARVKYERALRFVSALEFRSSLGPLAGLHVDDVAKLKALICAELGIDLRRIGTGPERGYMIIRSHSGSFGAEFVHTVTQLIVAHIARRRPIVYWGCESPYWTATNENLWTEFFDPIGAATLDELTRSCGSFFPSFFSAANLTHSNNSPWFNNQKGASHVDILGRNEDVVVVEQYSHLPEVLSLLPSDNMLRRSNPADLFRSFCARFVRPRTDLVAECRAWLRLRAGGAPVVAAHYRLQYDKKAMTDSIEGRMVSIDEYFSRIDALDPEMYVFVMTDFAPALAAFRRRYGDRVICHDVERLNKENYVVRQLGMTRSTGNYHLAKELMRDVFTAASCQAFILDGASNASIMVDCLSQAPQSKITWLRAPALFGPRIGLDVARDLPTLPQTYTIAADLLSAES